ncbi:MAG: TetR/AcrR family transcriptional regulator [Lachnospiraceae bacterium]|nr:TetR/AcrR family transcriptional regulator [Lachnospiraceae bacterium]
MSDTKESILITSLQLFAREGCEAVSVSKIAGELDMTKGALYKHYQNKRDIFDHIVARMEVMDEARAVEFNLPEGTLAEMEEKYRNVSIKQFSEYCKAQFEYWTEDEFASSFRKMLTLEQFRNDEMQKLYQQYLVAGPMNYVADLFKNLEIPDAENLAACLYAAMFFFYSMYDGAEDKEKIKEQFHKTLDGILENICSNKKEE